MPRRKTLSREISTRKKREDRPKKILVVGDWVVDEYWPLVQHHADISAHVGYIHYRTAVEKEARLLDLCGAGQVLRILHFLRERQRYDSGSHSSHSSPPPLQGPDPHSQVTDKQLLLFRDQTCPTYTYNLIGMGKWNKNDTTILKHIIHARDSDCQVTSAPYSLSWQSCKTPPTVRLETLDGASSTVRVIRQYHIRDGGLEQINRVDWEPAPVEPTTPLKISTQLLESVEAIIVYDLVRGVLNNELVKTLVDHCPNASWYVRTKALNIPALSSSHPHAYSQHANHSDNIEPAWLTLTNKENLKLFVIGPETASLLSPWSSWSRHGSVSFEGKKLLDQLPGMNSIIISSDHEIIARLNEGDCYVARSQNSLSPLSRVGWATTLFACLSAELIAASKLLEYRINRLIYFTDCHCRAIDIDARVPISSEPKPTIGRLKNWTTEKASWDDSMKGLGIICDGQTGKTFHVWRGATHLPNYVTCIYEKQFVINKIAQRLRQFSKVGGARQALSVMLQSDPGAGKTHLVKCLADAFNFRLIRRDITQMLHRDEIIDMFDYIATIQTDPGANILVFVDEINAHLEHGHVYGAFLAPLEEGVYVKRGRAFTLRPCVWIFAGTRLRESERFSSEKMSDFESRLTAIEKIDYESLKAASRDIDRLRLQARLEQVYLGAHMIRLQYPDVRFVEEQVLNQFYRLDPEKAPARRIRKMAASLRNVQYGQVRSINCIDWDEDYRPPPSEPVRLDFGTN